MYTDGTLDLMLMIALAAFQPPEDKEENYACIVKRAKVRYFPVFEKVGYRDPGFLYLLSQKDGLW
jgi:glutathione S-transferase